VLQSLPQFTPPAEAKLTAGDPIKNAQALLRNALPISNTYIRQIQVNAVLSNSSRAVSAVS
jgi:hypothetical protein